MKKIIALFLFSILALGCSFPAGRQPMDNAGDWNGTQEQSYLREQARAVADDFFSAMKAKDFQRALSLTSPRLFEGYSKAQFEGLFKIMSTRFGEPEKFELLDFKEVQEGNVHEAWLVYRIRYNSGDANATLSFSIPENGGKFELSGIGLKPYGMQQPFVPAPHQNP